MAQMGRPGLSVSQKEDMWRRWKQGESHSDIGRALGKKAVSIHGSIRIHGGIAPLPRKRSSWALRWQEREEISRGIAAGCSLRAIARSFGRATSTVSREIARNGGPRKYRDDDTMQISHETIYRTLYIQARGALKKELMAHLRTRRMMRRSKNSTTRGQPRGQIIDAISISERPAEVEDRAIPGHWEGI